jgi:hypothetical protein
MPEYKGAMEATFTADGDDEADVNLLECANCLENASLVLSATGRTSNGSRWVAHRATFAVEEKRALGKKNV